MDLNICQQSRSTVLDRYSIADFILLHMGFAPYWTVEQQGSFLLGLIEYNKPIIACLLLRVLTQSLANNATMLQSNKPNKLHAFYFHFMTAFNFSLYHSYIKQSNLPLMCGEREVGLCVSLCHVSSV